MCTLELQNVSKSFGRTPALHDVSFSVASGECVLLSGGNGAGKSTLLGCIAGTVRPDHGCILLFPNGSKVSTGSRERSAGEAPRSLRRQIGFVSQALFLYDDLTVAENLRLFADCCSDESGLRILSEEIARFQLSAFLERRFSECSQGIARRASIVRALLARPDLLLLDEPYSSLDQIGRAALDQVLLQYKSAGKTVILASHDPEILARHTGPRLILRGGEVVDATLPQGQSQQALH